MNKRRIQYGFAAFLLSVLNACGGVENFGAGMFGMGGAGGWRASDIVPSAPTIAITAPSGGTTLDVATTVTISGTCDSDTVAMRVKYGGVVISDRSGVSQVQISGTNWSFKWSPGKIRIGTQNLTAEGERIGSPTGTSSNVSVTVSGVPLRTKCNTYLDADDLTYNDGDQVSTWTARVGTNGSGNAGATMEVDAWVAGAYGAQKSVRLTSANSGRIDVDALASVISAGANQPLHVAIFGQTIGATGSRTLFSGGSSSSSTQKWLFWQNIGAPSGLRVLKGNTTTTNFDNSAKVRGDTGKHLYIASDSGTQVQAYRDAEARITECTISSATGGGANSGGTSTGSINRATIGSYCSNGTYGNFWDGRVRMAWFGTSAPTQTEWDYLLNWAVGNYDNDQYYGDSTQTWYAEIYKGQSNTASIAPSTGADVAVPGIRLWPRSINNWINDPAAHVDLAPQGSYVGAWYFGAIEKKALLGADHLHVMVFAKGATGINSFNSEADDDYYATNLYDEFCRQYAAFVAQMGGVPIPTMHWNQGESDGQTSVAAGVYGSNLTSLASKWRSRLATTAVPAVPIVVTEMNTNMGAGCIYNSVVNDGIRTFVKQDPVGNSVSFPTQDMPAATYLQGDVLHYNRDGQKELGHRHATVRFDRLGMIKARGPTPFPSPMNAQLRRAM